jgi:hypothetical protein
MSEPNVEITVIIKDGKLSLKAKFDNQVDFLVEASPIGKIDDTIKNYVQIAMDMLKGFQGLGK